MGSWESQVEFTKKKVNAAAWIIKKSFNLHSRLQGRSKSRRDDDVQEITDLWLQSVDFVVADVCAGRCCANLLIHIYIHMHI